MNKYFIALILGAHAVLIAGASNAYPIIIVPQPDRQWHFQNVVAYVDHDATQVLGQLNSANLGGLPKGHIDLAAYTASGDLIEATTTPYAPAILAHSLKKKGGVYFSASFSQPLPSDAIVKVAFHREPSRTTEIPSHASNIAK